MSHSTNFQFVHFLFILYCVWGFWLTQSAIILCYYDLSWCYQIRPVEPLGSWNLFSSFWYVLIVFWALPFFLYKRYFRLLILYFPCSSTGNSPFFKKLCFPLAEKGTKLSGSGHSHPEQAAVRLRYLLVLLARLHASPRGPIQGMVTRLPCSQRHISTNTTKEKPVLPNFPRDLWMGEV